MPENCEEYKIFDSYTTNTPVTDKNEVYYIK